MEGQSLRPAGQDSSRIGESQAEMAKTQPSVLTESQAKGQDSHQEAQQYGFKQGNQNPNTLCCYLCKR